MRLRNALVALSGLALLVGPALAGAQTAPKGMAPPDRKFITEAARGGLAEVALGKLAVERGSSEAVKEFGQRMVDDHGKANDELKALAQKKGVTLPTDLGPHKSLRDRLAKLSGAQFDRAYVDEMVKDHKKDVGEFQRQADQAGDADLKLWASKTLPTLQGHLKQIEQVQTQVKSGAAR